MKEYNYNFEIATNLKMFQHAFDETIVKRYDESNRLPKDSIKINYIYGPKQRIIQDILGQTDTVKLPIVAITTTGMNRDNERVKNKLQEITYKTPEGDYINLKAIPWNINVQMTIMCKYQTDLDQIITNFAVHTNPYIVYSWKEPRSQREIRTEVFWDGNLAIEYPGGQADLPHNSPFRIMATANFVIKTFLFRTSLDIVKPICYINSDYIITNNFYCNYEDLTANTANNLRDSFTIEGRPNLRYIYPYIVTESTTRKLKLQGSGFTDTMQLYASGNSDLIYPDSTVYYPNTADTSFSVVGVPITSYELISFNEIVFNLPAPHYSGLVNIIAANQCGVGKLTTDANRTSRLENPYSPDMDEYNSWTVEQFPYINGVLVYADYYSPTAVDCP